ncbi:MAG: urease accessory UreF family protein [Caldilineaceae bacterium]
MARKTSLIVQNVHSWTPNVVDSAPSLSSLFLLKFVVVRITSNHSQLLLQQLADSTFPIGGQAHSFGLETLVNEGQITPQTLEPFLCDYLSEGAIVDGWFCRQAYRLAGEETNWCDAWLLLNQRLSALRTARESRSASAALGRRFLTLVQSLSPQPSLASAYQASRAAGEEVHYATAFGFVGGVLTLGEEATVLFFLQQAINALLAATQKMMAIGQSQTVRILWQIKPAILAAAEQSRSWSWEEGISAFGPMLEVASMRHPRLPVRLFIS